MNMCTPPASAALLMWAFAVSWAVKHCVGIASLPHLPATQQTSTLTSPTSWHKLIMKRERERLTYACPTCQHSVVDQAWRGALVAYQAANYSNIRPPCNS